MDGVVIPQASGRRLQLAFAVSSFAAASTAIAIVAPAWLVLYAILLLLLIVPPALDLLTGRFDLMEARNIVIGYWFLDFGLGIVNNVLLDQREFVEQDAFNRLLPAALGYVDLSILLFYLGYYSPIGPVVANACPRLNPHWRAHRVNLVIALSSLAGLAAYFRFVAASGGFGELLMRQNQLAGSQLGKYYLVLAAFRLPLLATLICYMWARATGSSIHRGVAAVLIGATFLMGASMGARGAPVRAILTCAAAAYYVTPRQRFSRVGRALVATLALLAITVTIPLQTAIRAGGFARGASAGQVISAAEKTNESVGVVPFLQEFIGRFMAYEEFGRVLERTGNSVEPAAGKTFLEMFYGLVPRAFWPGKPDGAPLVGGQVFLDRAATHVLYWFPTLSWPGELYWNFFWPGIVVGMILSGVFCRVVYSYFRSNLNLSGILIYLPMLMFFQAFAIGGLGALVVESAVIYVPLIGLYFALTL